MKKQIACPVCNGRGYVNWNNHTEPEKSSGSRMCPHCDGTGLREVLQTNADRIRAMSDEELAEFIININTNCQECEFSNGWRCQPDRDDYSDFDKCKEGRKRWLQQPAEEAQ